MKCKANLLKLKFFKLSSIIVYVYRFSKYGGNVYSDFPGILYFNVGNLTAETVTQDNESFVNRSNVILSLTRRKKIKY